MNVRDLKLAIACGIETEEIKSLNSFFDDLFSSLTVYTDGKNPDLIFMKGDKCFMEQDLKNGYLWCRYIDFWKVLEDQYHCTYAEIEDIIQYKVEEAFKMGSLIPHDARILSVMRVEEAFKMGSLIPYGFITSIGGVVEEAFKIGALTPYKN